MLVWSGGIKIEKLVISRIIRNRIVFAKGASTNIPIVKQENMTSPKQGHIVKNKIRHFKNFDLDFLIKVDFRIFFQYFGRFFFRFRVIPKVEQ